jgi:hypothetical protein
MVRRHPGHARQKYAAATDGDLTVAELELWNNDVDREMCETNYQNPQYSH